MGFCSIFSPVQKSYKMLRGIYLTLYIDLCILLTSLLDGVMIPNYDSFRVFTMIGDASPISITV